MKMPSIMDVLGEKYPNVQAVALGDGNNYSAISHVGGDPLPSEETLLQDVLAAKQEVVWQAIQDERTRRQGGGVFIPGVDKWFHSDPPSRIQQLGLVMMGASMPANINWKTMDGSFVIMSPPIAGQIFSAVATLDMMSFAVAEQHRTAMSLLSDPTDYDFSAGWPEVFGG